MWVAKQNNKREHPATKQGIKTVLSKMHNCWFLFPPPPPPNNATFISNPVLSMEDFQPPHIFFPSVLLEQFSKCVTLITIPLPNVFKSL